jgi:hypothetical protein
VPLASASGLSAQFPDFKFLLAVSLLLVGGSTCSVGVVLPKDRVKGQEKLKLDFLRAGLLIVV